MHMDKKKKKAIRYLTMGLKAGDVAKKVGVTRHAVYKWLSDPVFNNEWEKYDRAFIDAVDAEIKSVAQEAVSVLRSMLKSPRPADRRFAVDKALSLKRDYRNAKTQDVTVKHEHFGNVNQSHSGTVEVKKLSREARKGLQAFLDETREAMSDN